MITGAYVGLHRVTRKLFADEFFRTDFGDTLIAWRRVRGERVAGLPLAEQLIVPDRREVPIAVGPAALRRLFLRCFCGADAGVRTAERCPLGADPADSLTISMAFSV